MGEVTLDIMKWGPNITDIRNLHKVQFLGPGDIGGVGSVITQEEAEKILARTIEKAPPGVIFSSNPHYGIYAKWDNLLVKAGFKMASPFCAINRVYAKTYHWKGKPYGVITKRPVWESPDGFNHWIHAMYYVKEPVPALKFDFEKFDGANGDTDAMKMWPVGYLARLPNPPRDPRNNYGYVFEPAYARLSHNCGCAMGLGDLKYGKFVDEEFYTIRACPEEELLPKGYTRFLCAGGLKFGTNLKKLVGDTAVECFHKFDVFG